MLYIKHLPTNWGGTLLRRGVPAEIRKHLPADKNGFRKCARLDELGSLKVNDCNQIIKSVAIRCNLNNPLNQKASGRRRAGITKIANAGLSTSEVCIAARHQSCMTNSLYQIKNEASHVCCYKAQ